MHILSREDSLTDGTFERLVEVSGQVGSLWFGCVGVLAALWPKGTSGVDCSTVVL